MEEEERCDGSPGSPFTVVAAAAVQEQHDYKRPQKAGERGGSEHGFLVCDEHVREDQSRFTEQNPVLI